MSVLLLSLSPIFALGADTPSVHGMLLFGTNKIYVSHLPMFHSPHDYQVLAELELPAEALATYKKNLSDHPQETVYTLVPEPFSLPLMVANPRPFHADLFRGHFERGGEMISEGITVKFTKILFFRKFVPVEVKPAAASFLLFGSGAESFLAHFIVAKPDFDQVIAVKESAVEGNALLLEAPGLSNLQPLTAPAKIDFRQKDSGAKLSLQTVKELYFETGDLAH